MREMKGGEHKEEKDGASCMLGRLCFFDSFRVVTRLIPVVVPNGTSFCFVRTRFQFCSDLLFPSFPVLPVNKRPATALPTAAPNHPFPDVRSRGGESIASSLVLLAYFQDFPVQWPPLLSWLFSPHHERGSTQFTPINKPTNCIRHGTAPMIR